MAVLTVHTTSSVQSLLYWGGETLESSNLSIILDFLTEDSKYLGYDNSEPRMDFNVHQYYKFQVPSMDVDQKCALVKHKDWLSKGSSAGSYIEMDNLEFSPVEFKARLSKLGKILYG
jgi:hypothetical protein